jgi:hypothetical protein
VEGCGFLAAVLPMFASTIHALRVGCVTSSVTQALCIEVH